MESIERARLEGRISERVRIAKELHDSVTQQMFLIKMYVGSLEESGVEDVRNQALISDLKTIVNHSIEELKSIASDLSLESITSCSFAVLLDELIGRYAVNNNTKFFLNVNQKIGNDIFRESVQQALYRVVQEFVSNSVRHSASSAIHIDFKKTGYTYILALGDNGCGFDINSVRTGSGISNIKGRLEEVGAVYNFKSWPNCGTRLEIEINEAEIKNITRG